MPDTDRRREILAAYAAGDQIAQIVDDLGLPRGLVADTVDKPCQYNRARAAAVVEDLEAGHNPAPAPDPDPAAAPQPPSDPQPQPDEAPAQLPTEAPGSFEDLLAAAYTAADPAAAKLADRIRRDVDAVAAILAAARAEQAARAKVERLRADLAAAEEELAALTTNVATPGKRRGRSTEQKGQP